MSGAWRTLNDGRKVFILGAAADSHSVFPQRSQNPVHLLANYSITQKKSLPSLGETTCYWCSDPVFFVRSYTGGCFLADSLPPPDWEIHPCWYDHQASGDSDDFIIKHYTQLNVRPLSESGGAYRTTSEESKKGRKKTESIFDIVADKPFEQLIDTPIFYKYQLKLLIDGYAYAIVTLKDTEGNKYSYAIANNLLQKLIKCGGFGHASHRLKLATFDYGKRIIRYVSAIYKPVKFSSDIPENVDVILAINKTK